MPYDTFLLDADDTLFDFSACCKNALRLALTESGVGYEASYPAAYLSINARLWEALERKEITHARLVVERFAVFLRQIGKQGFSCERLNDAYVQRLGEQIQTLDGAEDFLTKLKALGRIFIITNGTASVQQRRFSAFGMSRFVQGVFVSESVGAYKPSLQFFDYCRARIPRYDPKRTLVIGDSLTSDIPMAMSAGLDCVWFNPKGRAYTADKPPTLTATSYGEILRFIENNNKK